MDKELFRNYIEADHPAYDQWILDEAHGDLELADLIERREIMFEDISVRGGIRALEEDEQKKAQAELAKIYAQIDEKNKKLRIDVPEE